MKRFLWASLIIVSVIAVAGTISSENITVKDNLFVDKSGTPVTGTIEHLFGNKKIFMKIEGRKWQTNSDDHILSEWQKTSS